MHPGWSKHPPTHPHSPPTPHPPATEPLALAGSVGSFSGVTGPGAVSKTAVFHSESLSLVLSLETEGFSGIFSNQFIKSLWVLVFLSAPRCSDDCLATLNTILSDDLSFASPQLLVSAASRNHLFLPPGIAKTLCVPFILSSGPVQSLHCGDFPSAIGRPTTSPTHPPTPDSKAMCASWGSPCYFRDPSLCPPTRSPRNEQL